MSDEAGQVQGQPAAEPTYDRGEAVDRMVAAMAPEGSDAPSEETESTVEPTEEPADGAEAEESAEEPEEKPVSVEEAKAELEKVLAKLTPEQRAAVLGATDDAFAALTAKTRRLREREQRFVEQSRAYEAERGEFQELRKEFDQALATGRENPLEALSLFGWTLEDAHAFAISDNTVPHEKRMELLERSMTEKAEAKLKEVEAAKEALEAEREAIYRDRWHTNVASAVASVTPELHPDLAWYLSRHGADGHETAKQRIISLQTQVFQHFKGKKLLDEATALGILNSEVAAARSTWRDADPPREGAVKSANLEAGREPVTPPTSKLQAERHRPPADDDGEELTPAARIRRMVAAMG